MNSMRVTLPIPLPVIVSLLLLAESTTSAPLSDERETVTESTLIQHESLGDDSNVLSEQRQLIDQFIVEFTTEKNLSIELVDNSPVQPIKNITVSRDDDSQGCPICKEPFKREKQTTTSCGHTFHESCLKEWENRSITCPMCRSILRDADVRVPDAGVQDQWRARRRVTLCPLCYDIGGIEQEYTQDGMPVQKEFACGHGFHIPCLRRRRRTESIQGESCPVCERQAFLRRYRSRGPLKE